MAMSFPFAGIVDRKDLPDITFGWDNCLIEIVFFNSLYLTQDCLVIEQIFRGKQNEEDKYIHVALYNNELYLYNGHHRAIKAALAGEVGMLARLYKF